MIQTLSINLGSKNQLALMPHDRSANAESDFANALGRIESGVSRSIRKTDPTESRRIKPASDKSDHPEARRFESLEDAKPRTEDAEGGPGSEATDADVQLNDGKVEGREGAADAEADTSDNADVESSSTTDSAIEGERVIDEDDAASGEVAEQEQPVVVEAAITASATTQPEGKQETEQAAAGQVQQDNIAKLKPQHGLGAPKVETAPSTTEHTSAAVATQAKTAGGESQPETGTSDGQQDGGKSSGQPSQNAIASSDKTGVTQPISLGPAASALTQSDAGGNNSTTLPQGMTPVANQASALTSSETDVADDGSQRMNEARLTRGLASAINQRGGSLTLRLTPPEMGTVRIQVQLGSGTVNAQFHAETPSAHAMLTRQLSDLRSVLEGHGLTVEKLTVQPMNQGQFSGQTRDQGDGSSNNDGRSRGQYTRDEGGSRRDSQQQREQPQSFDPRDFEPRTFDQWFSRQTVALSEGV